MLTTVCAGEWKGAYSQMQATFLSSQHFNYCLLQIRTEIMLADNSQSSATKPFLRLVNAPLFHVPFRRSPLTACASFVNLPQTELLFPYTHTVSNTPAGFYNC